MRSMGRGTRRSLVEGQLAPASAFTSAILAVSASYPSTMHRMVPLPIRFADREDKVGKKQLFTPRC